MISLLAVALFIAFLGGIYTFMRRRKSRREALTGTAMVFAQVPAQPSNPGTAWMFPGTGEAEYPNPERTPAVFVDKRAPSQLPPGVRREAPESDV